MTGIVTGIVFIFLQQGITSIQGVRTYDSVEACWADAKIVMQDQSRYHMACLPRFVKGQSL